MPEAVCPLCRSAALVIPLDKSSWRYTCPRCGTFELRDFAIQTFGTQEHWEQTRLLLSKAARKASDEGHPLNLKDEESLLEAIAANHVGAYK
jgi:predicted RNA-binding Zn-ribbon protein involved in translation (DUF1610 family)